MTLRKFAAPLVLLVLAPSAHALTTKEGVQVDVEPILGYERVQKIVPTPHSKDRLMYGARVVAGWKIVAAEAEVTRGTDTESFPLEGFTAKDTDDRLKLGLRSSAQLSTLLSGHVRAGVQGTRNTRELTQGGTTTRTVGKIAYDPYAGLGLSSHLANNFSLEGGLTVVFSDFPHMARNEYQTTLGFSVSFP